MTEVTNIERIRPIPGGEGYTVSSLGIVRDPNGVPCRIRFNQDYALAQRILPKLLYPWN